MKVRHPHFDSDRVATISHAMVENSLRMRSMAFLSQVKMSLMLDTLKIYDDPLDYMRKIKDSITVENDNWLTLPVKISEEARELQQMTLTMERRREELRNFVADQMRHLRHSEIRFRQLFELMPDAVGIHQYGLWTFVNPAAATVFRAESPKNMVGTRVLDYVHHDERADVAERIRAVLTKGTAAPLEVHRLIRLDGSEFHGEIQGMLFSEPGEDGSVLTVMRDVTDRIQAERKMHQMATAVENTVETIMISDADACIEYVNPAFEQMTGYASDDVVGKYESILRSDRHPPAFFRKICDTVKSGHIWTGEVIITDKYGALITTKRSVSPVIASDGSVLNHITVMRDVTREKEIQAQLEHTQRLESLGILAGGIAHDFNNILTAIMGNAAMAGRSLDDASPAKEKLARIETSTQRAADLCKQMLAYSGKGKFIVKAINLSEMVEEMTRLMEVSIKKNVVIKYHLANHLPAVDADAAQLQQVILNLITNANEAIGDKSGVISFSTGVMHADTAYLNDTISGEALPVGRYVYVEVSDTGCGMDNITVKKMFDPFFTTKFTGRGLGMSAVLGIVRGHHGALRVYSEVGKGTTFKILLPASEQQVDDFQQTVSSVAWQARGTILVIDDEETIREVAAMMLEDMGFSILTAENGLQGVEVYRQQQHEIVGVLMDMTMPKMDGKACFRELRRINADVKVILSSGYNEQDATNRFVGQGLAGFIQKPYLPEAIQTIACEIWGKKTDDKSLSITT